MRRSVLGDKGSIFGDNESVFRQEKWKKAAKTAIWQ
jgi:hypothetical protein